MNFYEKLTVASKKNSSLLCIGLDSDINKLPSHIKIKDNPQFEFNKAIIDATYDLVCAYKPNSAFYEAEGAVGIQQLKMTMDYISAKYPEIVTIVDAKRADIGNTNRGYTKFIYDWLGADAVTLHPYLGKEALKPFLDRKEKGSIILCRTSNPGAGEFQDLLVKKSQTAKAFAKEDKPLYQIIAENVANKWNDSGNCGLVVGATYPTELEIVRRIAGNIPILIPGVGTQGADVEKTVKAGVDKDGLNVIINSSRAIIFASNGRDFAQKAKNEAINLKDEINNYR